MRSYWLIRTAPRDEELRLRRLIAARRRATALLVLVTAVFVVVTVVGAHGWLGYVQATAQASMVGGAADWFAVTALFRRPLGLPIPHTAIIVERKDQFGDALGGFVQQNFLNGDILTERLRAAAPAKRAAAWLADRDNALRLAGHAAGLIVRLSDLMDDEEIHKLLNEQLENALAGVQVAPAAGRGLRLITEGDRHVDLLDMMLSGADRFLQENRDDLRNRFRAESPRWSPEFLDNALFDRLLRRLRRFLHEVAVDPDHDARKQFGMWMAALSDRLEHSPEMRERGEQMKQDLLARAELREWSSSLWADLKETLREQAARPDSDLRRRLADLLCAAGSRLRDDQGLQDTVEQLAGSGVASLAEQFHDELASLVSVTIARWDASETSRKLELLLGRDLQFIRMNGTFVGALVGLILYSVTRIG